MAREIYSEAVNTGRNIDRGKRPDEKFVKCAKCGFICNTQRDHKGRDGSRLGYGIAHESRTVTFDDDNVEFDALVDFDGKRVSDPVVTSGCPLCGTYLYNK